MGFYVLFSIFSLDPVQLTLTIFFSLILGLPAAFGLEDFTDRLANLQEVAVTISRCNEGEADGHAVATLEAWHIQDWDMKTLHDQIVSHCKIRTQCVTYAPHGTENMASCTLQTNGGFIRYTRCDDSCIL